MGGGGRKRNLGERPGRQPQPEPERGQSWVATQGREGPVCPPGLSGPGQSLPRQGGCWRPGRGRSDARPPAALTPPKLWMFSLRQAETCPNQ